MVKSLDERFHEKYTSVPESGCWLWAGARTSAGYGQIWSGEKTIYAHRASYQIHRGEIPTGLYVCHTCDCRSCVNPDHLFIGTQKDNMEDAVNKGRTSTSPKACGESHPLSKLTEKDVVNIRADGRAYTQIAKTYNVDPALIRRVVLRKSWRHVQ